MVATNEGEGSRRVIYKQRKCHIVDDTVGVRNLKKHISSMIEAPAIKVCAN